MAVDQGMNTESVVALSTAAATFAAELERIAADLNSSINTTAWRTWLGPDATRFRDQWHRSDYPFLRTAASSLRGLNVQLRGNVDDQIRGSLNDGNGSFGHAVPSKHLDEDVAALLLGTVTPYRMANLRKQFQDLRDRPMQEQLDAWNSLTAREREALLRSAPGVLLALNGLSPEDSKLALDSYIHAKKELMVYSKSSEKLTVSASVKTVVRDYGAKGSISSEISTFRNGEADVKIMVEGEINGHIQAADVGKLGMSLGLQGYMTYHFGSELEAEQFVEKLKATAKPTKADINRIDNVVEELKRNEGRLVAFGGGASLGADVKLGVEGVNEAGVTEKNSLMVERRMDGSKSLTFQQELSYEETTDQIVGPGHQSDASGKATFTIEFDQNNQPTKLTISGEGQGQAGGNRALGIGGEGSASIKENLAIQAGSRVEYSVSYDLTDPSLARHVESLAKDLTKNPGAALQDLKALGGRAEIQISTYAGVSREDTHSYHGPAIDLDVKYEQAREQLISQVVIANGRVIELFP